MTRTHAAAIAMVADPILLAIAIGSILLRRAFARQEPLPEEVVLPVGTLVPTLAWAWGNAILDLDAMVRYHGLVSAADR